jgi:putative ABC transport system permease protein
MGSIAIKMLQNDAAKFIGLVMGVAFATLLVTNQGGIFASVLQQSTKAIKEFSDIDIWVMKPEVESIDTGIAMPYVLLGRVRSVTGVDWAVPFYISGGRLKTEHGLRRNVTIYGVDEQSFFGLPKNMVLGEPNDLVEPESIVLDVAAYRSYFPAQPLRLGDIVEIGSRRSRIVGLCGSDWTGVVYTRLSNALQLEGQPGKMTTFILVKAKDGCDPEKLAEQITSLTGLNAKTRRSFSEATVNYLYKTSGLVEAFGTTIFIGLVVGAVIVGQTFSMFVNDNLKQFAALKAIGVSNYTILYMLILQSLLVTIIGFGLGAGASAILFSLMDSQESALRGMGIPWYLLIGTAILDGCIVAVACLVSARKVLFVDPAIIYRG